MYKLDKVSRQAIERYLNETSIPLDVVRGVEEPGLQKELKDSLIALRDNAEQEDIKLLVSDNPPGEEPGEDDAKVDRVYVRYTTGVPLLSIDFKHFEVNPATGRDKLFSIVEITPIYSFDGSTQMIDGAHIQHLLTEVNFQTISSCNSQQDWNSNIVVNRPSLWRTIVSLFKTLFGRFY